MKAFDDFSEKTWVAVGDEANWERGLENGIWGLVPQLENHWLKIENGDLVLFYCKAPIKGFVGAGVIRSKFRQTSPYWKEELQQNKVIWPFRFEFDVTHLVPIGNWRSQKVSNKDSNLSILAGLNPVVDNEKALKVLDALQFTQIRAAKPDQEIASTIFEIGKIQRMIVEKEYPIEGDYLDVIWKRTIRSVPTYAFSINSTGDFEKSLRPLKHAFDIWNSRPFLITDKDRIKEAQALSSSFYHEFSDTLKVLSVIQVQDLYDSKKQYFDLEERYGLR